MQNKYGCNSKGAVGRLAQNAEPRISGNRRYTSIALADGHSERTAALGGVRPSGARLFRAMAAGPDGRDMIERRRTSRCVIRQDDIRCLWHRGSCRARGDRGEMAPLAKELVVDKNTSRAPHIPRGSNGCSGTEVRTIAVTALRPNMCVETTARDAADRGAKHNHCGGWSRHSSPRHHGGAVGFAGVSARSGSTRQIWRTIARHRAKECRRRIFGNDLFYPAIPASRAVVATTCRSQCR